MDVRVDESLWATSIAPEGFLERWRLASYVHVGRGETVAEVLIEDSRHEIASPTSGRLIHLMHAGDVIEPGAVIGRIEA